jgi:PadR family transcriptional regulator PadR
MKMQNNTDTEKRTIEIVDKLRLELRRGALLLAVLAQLREEHYGYSLRKRLNAQGLDIDEGTLYPLIRRLEKQGLLSSEWRNDEKRKKRYYRLSGLGESVLALLARQWRTLNESIDGILGEEQ